MLFVVAVLAALGVEAYLSAPQSMFPTMSFSRIDVVADAGDLPPEQVRVAITRPLEVALQTLPSVLSVRATSSQGSAELIAEFDPKTDPRVDLQYVEQALAQARADVPEARSIEATIVNPNSEPVVSYALTSSVLSQAVVRQLAQARIVPALLGTPGLARALLMGGPPVEYHVDLDPAALGATGLSPADVAAAVADANNVQSVGTGVTHAERYVFLIDSSVTDAASIGRIAIPLKAGGSVPLSAIARIKLGVAPETSQASFDAKHAVILNVFALPGADAVSLAHAVARRIGALQPRFAPNVDITLYWDQTRLIVDSQRSLRDAILLGALLAILVIYLFLRNIAMTLVAGAIIPLAMSIAILILVRSGQSLNLMSVGGLAVAVGLIIDDAIVVIEGIARTLEVDAADGLQAAIGATVRALARPMIASTATTVVVFVPLALLGGVAGYFFRALSFTLATALIVSLVLALLVTPLLAALALRARSSVHARVPPEGLLRRYEPILLWSLRHRAAVVAGAAGVLVLTVVLLLRLPNDFLPSMDEGQFEIQYTMPTGLSLEATDAAATTMERIVLRDPAVRGEGRLTGVDTDDFSPTQPNAGTIRVELAAGSSYDEVSARLRAAIAAAVPAASLDFHQILEDQINDLSGAPAPIEIALSGPSQAKLIDEADRLADAIAGVPGVVDPFNGVVYDDPAVPIGLSAARLAAAGLQSSDVASALTAGANGAIATQIPQDLVMVPIRIRVAGSGAAPGSLASKELFTKAGSIALSDVGAVGRPALASEINDENGRQVVRVTANIGNASLSSVIAGIKDVLAKLGLPPGYSATIGGAYEAQQASFADFFRVFGVAVVLVFTVMLGTFGSFRLPLVILTAIPLSLIGVALALFVTGTPFNVSSFMGLLLLIGIVVKNGILLIDAANRRRLAGDGVEAALIAAGKARLRPIVMTTCAAIGGLLPLALGSGSGAEMQKPLAIAVIGGLSTATLFTLIVIPVLYAIFAGFTRPARAAAAGAALVALCLIADPRAAPAQTEPATVSALTFTGVSLGDAVRRAIANSPDVRIATAALDGARATLDEARGSIGLSATLGYAEAPQGDPSGTISQRITSSTLGLSVGDLLAYGPQVDAALASERAAEADVADAERLERIKTIGLYYGALKARAIVDAREAELVSARGQLDAATLRYRAGDAPHLDVTRAEVASARARADLALARAADGNARDALLQEIAAASLATAEAGAVAPSGAVPAPADAVAAAERLRSDLVSAREAQTAAEAGLQAASRQAIPPITVSGGYASGVDTGFHIAGPTVNAQMTLAIPAAARDRVIAARTAVANARAKVTAVSRALALEVASAARNLAASIEAERASADALRSAREELDATNLGYRNGASSSLEVAGARSTYDQAIVDALSSVYDRLAAQATLDAEVGR